MKLPVSVFGGVTGTDAIWMTLSYWSTLSIAACALAHSTHLSGLSKPVTLSFTALDRARALASWFLRPAEVPLEALLASMKGLQCFDEEGDVYKQVKEGISQPAPFHHGRLS